MFTIFIIVLVILSVLLLFGNRPTGRRYGFIAAIVGAVMGSSVGIAFGGGAISGTFVFAMIFFVVASIVGNNNDRNKRLGYVCMAINHSKQWHGNQGSLKRTFHSYYRAQGYGDMYFVAKGMNFEADELVAAIQSHIGGARLSEPPSLVPSTVGL